MKTVYDHDLMKEVTFIITKWTHHLTDSGKDETINKKPAGLNEKFRLVDSDGDILAYGYSSDNSSFAPLDRYASSYGMTSIEYRDPEAKEYKQL